jgi:hypothetical protein
MIRRVRTQRLEDPSSIRNFEENLAIRIITQALDTSTLEARADSGQRGKVTDHRMGGTGQTQVNHSVCLPVGIISARSLNKSVFFFGSGCNF